MVIRYLIDTNVWIHYFKRVNPNVESRLRTTLVDQVAVCSVIWAELLHGAEKYERRDERVGLVRTTLSPYRSYAFKDSTAAYYAAIRHELELVGAMVGPHDLLIAAIAREHSLTLVTNDAGFRRISGLIVEDWTVA